MITADVTKLSCEFVRQVKQYFTQVDYITEPCLDEVYYYFSKYKQATTLVDCLTHEDECNLITVASNILPEAAPCITTVSCANAAAITLSKSSKLCNYTVTLKNPAGIESAFPVLNILDDTIYQPAVLNVHVTGCGQNLQTQVTTGCVNTSNLTPPVCDVSYNTHININYRLAGLANNTNGYIKTLRVYATGVDGVLINTPIDLNLAPSNLAAWTSCIDCSGISAAQLYFGHPNWENAFKALMDNVTYTLYGDLNSFFIADIVGTSVAVSNKIKHNPSGVWMGINKLDFRLQWVDTDGTTITNTTPSITYSGGPNFIADDFSIATTCGNLTGRVVMSGGSAFNFGGSNFNELVVAEPTLNKAASIVNLVSPSCTSTTLKAAYSTTQEVLAEEWIDSDDNTISVTSTANVIADDIYTYALSLDSGCIVSKTITVP